MQKSDGLQNPVGGKKMAQKSRELDRQLAEIIVPLGFKKIPKTRYFIRLCGDGVLQGVHWYHEPRYTAQALEVWINSIYADPDGLFRSYLSWYDSEMMFFSVSCAAEIYTENEYIPIRRFCNFTEEEQLAYFQQQVLPRFERWQTPKEVFCARQGSEMASGEGLPLFLPRYHLGRDLNLAMYLNLPEEVEKYLDGPIAFLLEREDLVRRGLPERDRGQRKEKEEFVQKRNEFKAGALWTMNEKVQNYLQQCKKQNLYDFERILRGERGTIRYNMAGDIARPFFLMVRDRETVPVHWGTSL